MSDAMVLKPTETEQRRGLTDSQRMLIEQRITNDKPSTGVAYLLWFFLWFVGGHRFYLGRTGTAITMLVFSITVIGLAVTAVWAFIDLFLIPSIVRENVDAQRQRLTLEALG
jgi:TM2 domain-containing membrane protein YozV